MVFNHLPEWPDDLGWFQKIETATKGRKNDPKSFIHFAFSIFIFINPICDMAIFLCRDAICRVYASNDSNYTIHEIEFWSKKIGEKKTEQSNMYQTQNRIDNGTDSLLAPKSFFISFWYQNAPFSRNVELVVHICNICIMYMVPTQRNYGKKKEKTKKQKNEKSVDGLYVVVESGLNIVIDPGKKYEIRNSSEWNILCFFLYRMICFNKNPLLWRMPKPREKKSRSNFEMMSIFGDFRIPKQIK